MEGQLSRARGLLRLLGGRHFEGFLDGRNGRRRWLEGGSWTRNHRRRLLGGRGGMGEEGEIEVRCEEPDGEQNCPRQRGCKKSQFPLAAAGLILWGLGSRGGCLDIRRRPRVEHVYVWLHGRVCLRKIGHVCSAHGRSGMQLGSKGVVSRPIESAFSYFHFQNKPHDASRCWAGVQAASKKISRPSCRVEESHCRSGWTNQIMHSTRRSRYNSNSAGCRSICRTQAPALYRA